MFDSLELASNSRMEGNPLPQTDALEKMRITSQAHSSVI